METQMKVPGILLIITISVPLYLNAASFNLNGEDIKSSVTEKIVECDSYKVKIVNEQFPYKYEMEIPQEFQIEGFYGSSVIVNKAAFILPSGTRIPNPNDIENLKETYPTKRTYLAGSAVCKGDTLIISYWSGGNCKECEAFVQFKVIDGQPTRAEKVDYSHVRALKQ
jgi:hypothetical protein